MALTPIDSIAYSIPDINKPLNNEFSKIIINEEGLYFFEDNYSRPVFKSRSLTSIPDAELFVFAPEKIIKSYQDFVNCKFQNLKIEHEPFQVACFLPGIHITPAYLLQLISLLNRLPSINFSLYIDSTMVNIVASFCNEHIQIVSIVPNKAITVNTHIILTYGLRAIHFLQMGIPVFILGPNGLGGLVTSVNLPFLFDFHFMGRPGGSLYEHIPLQMVAHELGVFKDLQDVQGVLKENQRIANTYSIKPLSKEISIQQTYTRKLQETYNSKILRDSLIPKLYSNMHVIKSSDIVMIRRANLHDTICTLDKDDAAFIMDMDGVINCGDLRNKYEMDEHSFWEIIAAFVDKEVITLDL